MRPLLALIFLAATPAAFAQSTTPATAPAPSSRPVSTKPGTMPSTQPSSTMAQPNTSQHATPPPTTPPPTTPQQANPALVPSQTNPASALVQPASDAGATERGLAPVQPATGVTPKVSNAANHNTDAAAHTLDPHGKPVGQAPAPTSTTR